jgi:hypothetical protein
LLTRRLGLVEAQESAIKIENARAGYRFRFLRTPPRLTSNKEGTDLESMRRVKLFSALLVLASIQVTIKAQAGAAVRKELETSYASMAKALKEKDLQTLMSYLAGDYTQKGLTGTVANRRQVERDLKQTIDSMETLSATYKIISLAVGKNETTANILYSFSGLTKPDQDPQGRAHRVEFVSPMRATWTKLDQGWRLKRMEELKGGLLKVDGKPSKPPGN